ncbi:type II toxin-antitoxin system HipA family toxin, partial [candidate division KSB1 bacterium]|nr:type II toxin-antitoxin system HipA family toxin [candidate division KSB1 bacterium]
MVNRVEVAEVRLWNRRVGAVAWNEANQCATFEFAPAFLENGLDIAPITMPLERVRAGSTLFEFRTLPAITYHGLPGLLSDSLPDRFGNALIDRWLAVQGRLPDDFNVIERLCYTGKRGMGALEFKPAIQQQLEKSVPVEVEELTQLARMVLDERSKLATDFKHDPTDALLNIIRVGTSAGGNRPKAVIAYDPDTGQVRSGQVEAPEGFDYWLLKFDGVQDKVLGDPKGYCRIEYAYYLMAKAAGIDMMECRLLEESGRAHFMTRRFDRPGESQKLHVQSLCGIAHFDFNAPGTYSYEQAFQIMRQLRLPYSDAEQQYLRMVFNIVARNQDDHTKNIAFIMDT